MPLKLKHRRYHLAIFGGSDTGKTTAAENFLRRAKATVIFIFDPDGEFSLRFGVRAVGRGAEIDAAVNARAPIVCFDPNDLFPGDHEGALVWFSRVMIQWAEKLPGRIIGVIDELQLYVSPTSVPKPVKALWQTGRRYGLDMLLIGQQPNEIPDAVLAQITESVCFQLTSDTPKTLNFLRKFRFNAEEVERLQRFQWVSADNQGKSSRSK